MNVLVVLGNNLWLHVDGSNVVNLHLPYDLAHVVLRGFKDCDE